MNTNTGPNADPKEPETQHPGTEDPRPPEAGQEAEGGGDGAAEAPPLPPPSRFEDLLRQMQEMAGGGSPASDADRRKVMRANLMGQVMGLLPQLIDYVSMASEEASEEEQPEAEEPVAEYIPTDLPVGFGSRPFDVETVLFGEQVKKQKGAARHHGFMLGLGLGSTISALGAATLVKEFIWNLTEVSTDLGSVFNAAFGKNRMQQAMPHIMRAVAPDPAAGGGFMYGAPFPHPGYYHRVPGPRAPNPAVGLKYGASFPDESEYADDSPAGEAPVVELPGFEEFLKNVTVTKAKIDLGIIEVAPEVKSLFDQFGKLFEGFVPVEKK